MCYRALGLTLALALSGCSEGAGEDARARVVAAAARCGAAFEVTAANRSDANAACSEPREAELVQLAACYEQLACAGGQMGEADLAALRACLSDG